MVLVVRVCISATDNEESSGVCSQLASARTWTYELGIGIPIPCWVRPSPVPSPACVPSLAASPISKHSLPTHCLIFFA